MHFISVCIHSTRLSSYLSPKIMFGQVDLILSSLHWFKSLSSDTISGCNRSLMGHKMRTHTHLRIWPLPCVWMATPAPWRSVGPACSRGGGGGGRRRCHGAVAALSCLLTPKNLIPPRPLLGIHLLIHILTPEDLGFSIPFAPQDARTRAAGSVFFLLQMSRHAYKLSGAQVSSAFTVFFYKTADGTDVQQQ